MSHVAEHVTESIGIRISQRAGVPLLLVGQSLPTLPTTIGNTAFLTSLGSNVQAAVAAEFALRKGWTRAALLVDDQHESAVALGRYFKETFTLSGGELLEYRFNSPATRAAQLKSLKAQNPPPAVLYLATMGAQAARVTDELRSGGFGTPILGSDSFDSSAWRTLTPDHASDIYYTSATLLSAVMGKSMIAFTSRYRSLYGAAPTQQNAALAYDTLYLITDAVGRAKSLQPRAIRAALADTQNFKGVTGTLYYPSGSSVPHKQVFIVGIEQGVPRLTLLPNIGYVPRP